MIDASKIKIKRRNDLVDLFFPYEVIINNCKKIDLNSGESKSVSLENGLNKIEVKYLYFSKKIEVHSETNQTILISSFINRFWLLFFLILFILFYVLISFFYNTEFEIFYDMVYYICIGFMSMFVYFCTIGYKNYLNIDFIEN